MTDTHTPTPGGLMSDEQRSEAGEFTAQETYEAWKAFWDLQAELHKLAADGEAEANAEADHYKELYQALLDASRLPSPSPVVPDSVRRDAEMVLIHYRPEYGEMPAIGKVACRLARAALAPLPSQPAPAVPDSVRRDADRAIEISANGVSELDNMVEMASIGRRLATFARTLSEPSCPASSAGLDRDWLVWSNEHDSFWRPGSCGYTYHTASAGRYSFEEARKICESADYRSGSENDRKGIPPEVMVPSPELIERLRAALAPAPAVDENGLTHGAGDGGENG